MPKLLNLKEAAVHLHGHMTPRSVLRLIKKGKLPVVVIGRKFYVTAEALDAMVVSSTLTLGSSCPDPAKQPGSTSEGVALTDRLSGLSSTERAKRARAQAEMIARELKEPLKPISPRTTVHLPEQIARINSWSRK